MTDITLLSHYLQPVTKWLAEDGVTEVVINGPHEIGIETRDGWRWEPEPDLTFEHLMTLARAAAAVTKQDINETHPICSTTLPNGERCQIVIPPAVPAGTVSFTIRKPSSADFSLTDFEQSGLFDDVKIADGKTSDVDEELIKLRDNGQWKEFFTLAVRARKNIIISGATGSGKTTFSKALLNLIPHDERLLTIEDARELTMPHKNVVHMLYAKDGQGQAKTGAKELLESALRMKPDRILLQELRDGTAFFYMRNVNSGHPGSITTVHADSAELAFEQLTLLVKESPGGSDLAREDIRGLLTMLVDVIVQMKRVGGRFRMTEVYFDPIRKRQRVN